MEQELKAQREIMAARFEAMNQRFESMQMQMDKRFDSMDKRFDTLRWMWGGGVVLITLVISLFRFLS